MADINVIASFKVNNPAPADAKYIVANEAGITALINAGNAYAGMLCYVQDKNAVYIVKENGTSFEPLLKGTAGEIGDLADRADALEALHATTTTGEGETAVTTVKTVAQEVTAGIEALDAEVTSADGARVTVKVTEVDGKITAVNVTEDDIAQKSELDKLIALHAAGDHDGYATVAEEVAKIVDGAPETLDTLKEIANWINDSDANVKGFNAAQRITDLETAVGAEAKAAQGTEGEEGYVAAKDATGLYKYVDDAVAAANSSAEDAIEALDATVDSTGGTKVSVQVVEENGKITGVTVAEDDIASAALLGTATDDKTKATAFGAIAAEADARATAIDNLEADFTGDKAVSDTDGFVKVALKEEDGVITTLTVATTDIAKASELDALEAVVGTEAVTGENAADATGLIKDIRALEAKMGNTDVAAQITSAIQALDVDTYTSGVSSTDGKVTVGLTEADGKITALTVATDDIASASALGKLQTAVGISELAEGADSIDTRLQALETGDNSVATQIENAIDALEGEATSTEGTFVTVKVTTTDGEVTAVNVTESDIASATLLGETTDDKTKATAFGYIAAEADRATTAEGTLSDLIGTVPAKVGETATANVVAYVDAKVAAADGAMDTRVEALEGKHAEGKTVAEEATDAIANIAEHSEDNGSNDLVKVTVTTKAGSVSAVAVDDSALDTLIGTIPAKVGETDTASVVAYVDAKVAAADSAADTRLDALEALHAKVGGDGEDKDNFLTVAQEIAKVVDNAPEAFDTLKEIADWIGTGDVVNTTAATMLADIATLKGADTVDGSVAKALKDAKDYTDTEIGKLDATVFDGQETAASTAVEAGSHVAVKIVEEDGVLTSVTLMENDIASAAYVGTASEGTKGAEGYKAATGLTAKVEALEALAGTTSVADQIKTAVEALDADITSTAAVDGTAAVAAQGETAAQAAVASSQKVQVQVTEVDGKITTVAVTEKDIASQVVLDEEIARAKAAEKKLSDDIGTANTAAEGQPSNATGLTARVESLEELQPCTAEDIVALFAETNAAV